MCRQPGSPSVALRPRVQCCPPSVAQQDQNCRWNQRHSAHWCSRDPACPLSITDATCECEFVSTSWENTEQRALGRVGYAPEQCQRRETLARVCREAGAFVRVNAKLRDMNVEVRADDEGAIGVLASGLPIHQGAQLTVDITVRSPLTSTGLARVVGLKTG